MHTIYHKISIEKSSQSKIGTVVRFELVNGDAYDYNNSDSFIDYIKIYTKSSMTTEDFYSTIIHEMTHVYIYNQHYDTDLFANLDGRVEIINPSAIMYRYHEACAITVEDIFRSNMNYQKRNSHSGFKIGGYASWPWDEVSSLQINTPVTTVSLMHSIYIGYDIIRSGKQ